MSTLSDTKYMKINQTTPEKHKHLAILRAIPRPPKYVFYTGTLPETRLPSVAIVGTRKPTTYGKEVTYKLAYDLAKKGIVIISGLALGTDGIAHRGALDAGGTTIAVLANSVDHIYPRSHQTLGEQIITNGGAILSEYEPPTSPREFQFLARNRIVSGLADAVVITEAASRSGTLNTAAHALEQGKEVFAVPGNITSPLSAGCNALLRQGATPATRAEDVIEVIAPHLLQPQTTLTLGDTPLETTILTLIQSGIRDGDVLQQQSGASASKFNQSLTMLEINGTLRSLGGNQWTLT
jgi:DNA processing protein